MKLTEQTSTCHINFDSDTFYTVWKIRQAILRGASNAVESSTCIGQTVTDTGSISFKQWITVFISLIYLYKLPESIKVYLTVRRTQFFMKARTYSLLSALYHKHITPVRTSFTIVYSSYKSFGRLYQCVDILIRRLLMCTEMTQNLCPHVLSFDIVMSTHC